MNKKNIFFVFFATVIGVLSGLVSFLFLNSLNIAITLRENFPWLILFLPGAGVAVVFLYQRFGKEIESGSNLVLDEIHEPKRHIPFKMVPMIFLTSTVSHLFGASVGREGAAVQMGAGLSDTLSKYFHKELDGQRKIFLMMGMSAGFASIFGAPLAGTIFGMEVFALNFLHVEALLPCLIAGVIGYFTTLSLGLHQTNIAVVEIPPLHLTGILSAIIAGVFFGLAARFFSWAMHFSKKLFNKNISHPLMRPFVGGILVAICFYAFGNDRYLNLGEEVIRSAFYQHVYPWDFLGKIWMTSLSLGSGFKGGEVMPLFYVGATLGNSLSYILWLSYPVLAALGFVAVFAGAAKTPITGIILAMEFFGPQIGVYAALAVVTSYLFSGSHGIYSSQRGIK